MQSFYELNPNVYHLCDGDVTKNMDAHDHYGTGNYPLRHFLQDFTDENAYITMETGHGLQQHKDVWVKDYEFLKLLN